MAPAAASVAAAGAATAGSSLPPLPAPVPPPAPRRWLPEIAPAVEPLQLPRWDFATLRMAEAFRQGEPLPVPGRDWGRPEALADWHMLRRRLVGAEAQPLPPPPPSPSPTPTPTRSPSRTPTPTPSKTPQHRLNATERRAAEAWSAAAAAASAAEAEKAAAEAATEEAATAASAAAADAAAAQAAGVPTRVAAAAQRLVTEQLHAGAAPDAEAARRAGAALHAFAITNDYYTYTCEFMRSCLLNGIVPHIVGFDEEIPRDGESGRHNYNWGLGKPLLWMRPPLLALAAAAGEATMVLLADAHDSLVLAPAATIVARFRYLQRRRPGLKVLLSAERSCFPVQERECAGFPPAHESVPCGGGAYPNLNSGSLIGEARDVLAVLADVDRAFPQGLEAADMNDQAAMQYAYMDEQRRDALGLGLDHTNQLFQAMHLSLDEVAALGGADTAPPWRYCNSVTGGCPAVLHFNGGSKHAQVPMDNGLFTSLLTTDAGATDPAPGTPPVQLPPPPPTDRAAAADADAQRLRPLREAVDGYVVGGLRMTVRDFCCSAAWTSTQESPSVTVPPSRPGGFMSNHARAAWLKCG